MLIINETTLQFLSCHNEMPTNFHLKTLGTSENRSSKQVTPPRGTPSMSVGLSDDHNTRLKPVEILHHVTTLCGWHQYVSNLTKYGSSAELENSLLLRQISFPCSPSFFHCCIQTVLHSQQSFTHESQQEAMFMTGNMYLIWSTTPHIEDGWQLEPTLHILF